jgi:hypothetical protein
MTLAIAAVVLTGCHRADRTGDAAASPASLRDDPAQLARFDETAADAAATHQRLRLQARLPLLPAGAPVVRVLVLGSLDRETLSETAARTNGAWTVETVDELWDYERNRAQPVKVARSTLSPAKGRELDRLLASGDLYRQPRTSTPICLDGANVFLEVLRAGRDFRASRVCRADGTIERIVTLLRIA